MNKELKKEARNRIYDHYGNPPAEQISKDIDYYIDKATLAERERCADIVKEWERWSPESDEELDNLAKAIKDTKV